MGVEKAMDGIREDEGRKGVGIRTHGALPMIAQALALMAYCLAIRIPRLMSSSPRMTYRWKPSLGHLAAHECHVSYFATFHKSVDVPRR